MNTLPLDITSLDLNAGQVLSEANLNALARNSSFMKRKRKLSGALFFNSLLCLVRSKPVETLSDMCLSLFKLDGKMISRQAFDQRFNEKSVEFVRQVFGSLLALSQKQYISPACSSFFKDIEILDSTKLSKKPSLKMQLQYRLLSGQITYLLTEPGNTQDHCHCESTLETVESNVLYLRDKGYYKIAAMKKIAEGDAFFLSRLHAESVFYCNGKKETIASIVQAMILSAQGTKDMEVELTANYHYPVRLIVQLIDLEQAKKRIKHACKQSGSHNYKLQSKTVWACCANVLITNVPKTQLKPNEAFGLYHFRGQIEVLFRALKSFLQAFTYKQGNEYRLQTMIYLKMIAVWLSIHQVWKAKTHCWENYAVEISELKAFRILCLHGWQKFITHFIDSKTQFDNYFISLTLKFAIKKEPKGKRTPFELLLAPP